MENQRRKSQHDTQGAGKQGGESLSKKSPHIYGPLSAGKLNVRWEKKLFQLATFSYINNDFDGPYVAFFPHTPCPVSPLRSSSILLVLVVCRVMMTFIGGSCS